MSIEYFHDSEKQLSLALMAAYGWLGRRLWAAWLVGC